VSIFGSNQSLAGLGAAAGLHDGSLMVFAVASSVVVVAAGARRALRYQRDGQKLLALAVLACVAGLISPVTPVYAMFGLGLAAVGRLGKRREDRLVWPLVAFVALLIPPSSLDPHVDPITSFALRHTPGLLALAVVLALPFRLRGDLWWTLPPRPAGRARRRAWQLPDVLVGRGRPNLILELVLIQVGYGFYTWIRNAAPNHAHRAVDNANQILAVERFLHVDIERWLNHATRAVPSLENVFEEYYKTLHFAVPLGVLTWLYCRRPQAYRPARSAFFAATGLALIGFWTYPLAPPRLTPGHGFTDTLHHSSGSSPFGAFTHLANQFAAMPSLHIAWSTWCALVLATMAPSVWLRVLGVVYPCCTLYVVLATANHWVLDAVGGLLCLLIACVLQQATTRRQFPGPLRRPYAESMEASSDSVELSRRSPEDSALTCAPGQTDPISVIIKRTEEPARSRSD
jgi:hypothetical protein